MTFALMLFHEAAPGSTPVVPAEELDALRELLSTVPGMTEALIFTPATARDQYTDDGASPPLGLQLHFPRLELLEAACAPDGPLQQLGSRLPSLAGTDATVQAFWRRTWDVPDPQICTPAGALPCSFVVHYPGPAQDDNAWHAHYMAGHPPLFARFPGIRWIEILTPVDWVSFLPHTKVRHLQRNRILFDSSDALTAALQSPVRHELRADYHTFPAYDGGNKHFAMWTETLRP